MFPFGINSESAFLVNEINYLCQAFSKVTIIPQMIVEGQTTVGSFTTDLSLARHLRKRNKPFMLTLALLQPLFYKEILFKKISFWDYPKIKRLIYYTARYALIVNWFRKYLIKNRLTASKVIIYTYWNTEITTALLDCRQYLGKNLMVSRAHGHDLYEDYWGYIPCRYYNLKHLDQLFLVSRKAIDYVVEQFPEFDNKLILSYLGVKVASNLTTSSSDGILRIISCSYVVKVKRIDLIIISLSDFATRYKMKVEWTHFGDGPLMNEILSRAESASTEFFTYQFKGFVPNETVLEYYENNTVDLFINLSESEGLPLAIQEAQAHGIPIVAVAVGGIPELVTSETGVLVSLNPTKVEIANAISKIIYDKNKCATMKNKCVENWDKHFNQAKNYRVFVDEISGLI